MGNRVIRYLDTCECVIAFTCEGEDHLDPATINLCSIHAELTDPTQHRDALYAADLHRAMVQIKIIELLPEELKVIENGEYAFAEIPEMIYDESGDLKIKIDGLTTEESSDIQSAVNDDEDLSSQVDYQVIVE